MVNVGPETIKACGEVDVLLLGKQLYTLARVTAMDSLSQSDREDMEGVYSLCAALWDGLRAENPHLYRDRFRK